MSAPFYPVGSIVSIEGIVTGAHSYWLDVSFPGVGYRGSLEVRPEYLKPVSIKSQPKAKVGDKLTSREVAAIRWKRGSVIRSWAEGDGGVAFQLTADGEWICPVPPSRDGTFPGTTYSHTFKSLASGDWDYIDWYVLHVAE